MIEGTVLNPSNTPICSGRTSSINISVTPTNGTYSGTFTNGRNFSGLTPNANIIRPTYTFTNNTTSNITENFTLQSLTFFPTGGNGLSCPATSLQGSADVTVQPVADISAVLNSPSNLCNNGSVSITVSNPNMVGGTYRRTTNYGNAGHMAPPTANNQPFGNFTDQLSNSTNAAITVTYTFTPVSVNSGCEGMPVQISVVINPNPTITCPDNKTVGTDPDICMAIVNGIDPTFTPATCNGAAPTITYTFSGVTPTPANNMGSASGKTFNKGTTTVTYNITDAAGNTGTPCMFTVTVNDTQGPTFTNTLQPDINTTSSSDGTGNCGAVVTYTPYMATDNCGGAVTITYSHPSGTNFPVGTTTVTVTATDNATPANSTTDHFTVTVTDDENPTITCPANITRNNDPAPNECGASVSFMATAMDNCSAIVSYTIPGAGTITSPYTFPVGTTTVTATATDPAGHTATCSFTVTVNNVGAIYVNDVFTAGDTYTTAAGDDINGTGTKCKPFATIAKAISVASLVDTIYVDGGTYREDNITISKKLQLRGHNFGINPNTGTLVSATIVQPLTSNTTQNTGRYIFAIGGTSGVRIDGFTIDGDNPAIGGGVLSNGVDINAAYGIAAQGPVSNDTITNNIVKNISDIGIILLGNGAATSGNIVSDNKFDNLQATNPNRGVGVYAFQNAYTKVNNNTMTRVKIGVQTTTFGQSDPGNPVNRTISNNTIESSQIGIWHNNQFGSASTYTINNNIITTYTGATANNGIRVSNIGGSVSGTVQATIMGNNITGALNGYNLWSNPTTPAVKISGGSVTNCTNGVLATNYDAEFPTAIVQNATYVIEGVTVMGGTNGVFVKDDPLNSGTSNPNTTIAVQIIGNTKFNTNTNGLVIEGASASATFPTGTPPATFTGQTSKYIQLRSNGTDVPAGNIDATTVVFGGQTGAAASTAQNFATEDKIDHKIDLATLGFVLVNTGNDYVTTNSFVVPNTSAKVQRGVDAASNGFIVNVDAGTFTDNVIVNKEVFVRGSGMAITKINGVGGTGNIISIAANNVTISDLHVEGPVGSSPTRGIYFGGTTSTTKIINVEASLNQAGLLIDNNAVADHVSVLGSSFGANGNGFGIAESGRLDSLTIRNTAFNSNEYGLSSNAASGGGNDNGFTRVLITNSIFTGNRTKGMYFEKLSNAAITNDTLNNNGSVSSGAGLDVNLKYGTYSTIIINGNILNTNGFGTGGPAIAVKARNDAPSYTAMPATLNGIVAITNNEITTAPVAIAVGNNVDRSTIRIDSNNISSTRGIVNYDASGSNVTKAYNNSILTSGMAIETGLTTADSVNAECNWFGTVSYNAITAKISGHVDYNPYLTNGMDNGPATPGFQPVPNSCTGTPVVIASAVAAPETCAGNGSITVTFSGGMPQYSIMYTRTSTGSPVSGSMNNIPSPYSPYTITNLPRGTYSITITDGNGSTATTAATVNYEPVKNVSTNMTYATIQAAVNSANPNDSITVCSDTYNEQVAINKTLRIQGLGPVKPVINYTGTPANTARATLFDVTAPSVTIRGFEFRVNMTQLGSAIIASAANVSNLTIQNNDINPYQSTPGIYGLGYGLRNAVSINYAGLRVNGSNPINILATGNNINYITNSPASAIGFRSGFDMDEGTGTFDNNIIQTINQDIQVRFASAGSLAITNNVIKGGGVEISESNAGAETFTISGNTFNGTFGSTFTSALRLKNNTNGKTTTVSNNTLTGHNLGISLENYRAITIDNNVFTPASGSTTYRHIVINTKEESSSSGFFTPNIDGTFTNNTFNGSGAAGGLGLAFYNQDNDSPLFGNFTIGTAGNENSFNAGVGTFIYLDNNTGTTNPNATSTVPFNANLDATNNKYDVGAGLQLPAAMSLVNLFLTEDKIQHKIDTATLGFVLVKANNNYITTNSFVAPGTIAFVQRAVNAASTGFTVNVANGVYNGDVDVNKSVTVRGQSQSAVLRGLYAGNSKSVRVSASNVTVKNVTITRDYGVSYNSNPGNDWVSSTKTEGIIIENVSNVTLDSALVTANRNGVYVHSVPGFVIKNSIIRDNRTGFQMFGDLSNGQIINNFITNNFTHGVLINFDQGATNAQNLAVNNNNISGNWYSQIDFQNSGAQGNNVGSFAGSNFNCNWYGTVNPDYAATNAGGPGYNMQVPSQFGGMDPGVNADIRGKEAALITYVPYLTNGTDANAPDSLNGFQPVAGSCNGSPIVISSVVVVSETCGGNNGSITLTFSGGISPYNISYTRTSPASPAIGGMMSNITSPYNISPLPAGTYSITITDAIGTVTTTTATITYNPVTNVTQSMTYTTIQGAVNAANAGDSITVCSGNYNEQVVVNKALKIQGLGPVKPVINYTGVAANAARATLFDVTAANVTIRGFDLRVDLTRLGSAIIASAANVSNLTVQSDDITPYMSTVGTYATGYGLRNAVSINYGALRVNGSNPTNILATGNTINLVDNSTPANLTDDIGFRSGFGIDEGSGTFDNNVVQTISQDIQARFTSVGDVVITNNTIKGGGIEIAENNAGANTFNVSNNIFNGTYGSIYSSALRLKNNVNNKATTVSNNTFTGHEWGISLENYRAITVDNNVFTPAASSITYRHITVNTKELSSSSGFFAPNINGTFTRNTFNGSGAAGGLGIAFYNQDNDNPMVGPFTIGTSGNENNFNAGVGTFIYLDNMSGTTAPNATPTAPFSYNLDATNNKFDVGAGLQLPSAISLANLYVLEDKVQHKIDAGTLGFVLVKTANTYVTPNSFIAPNTTASVQRGVDAAGNNFTVNVKEGAYNDNLVINKNLTFLGAQRGVMGTATRTTESVLQAPTTGSNQLFSLSGSGVTVTFDGFKIQGKNVGVISDATQNLTMKNSLFELNFSDLSNNLYSAGSSLTLTRNLFKAETGINPSGGSSHIFSGAATLSVTENKFTSADATSQINGSTTSLPVWLNIVDGTQSGQVSQNLFDVIDIGALLSGTVSGVSINNNDFSNAKRFAYTNDASQGYGAGIALFQTITGTGNSITNNNFTNGETGIRTSAGGNGPYTLPASLGIHDNSFTNISLLAIRATDAFTGTLDATCNWFGTNIASEVVTKVSPQFNYIPYRSSGTDDAPTMVGFQTSTQCTACTMLTATITKTNNQCNGGSTGTITASANGGVGPYTYTISPSPASVMQNSAGSFTGLPAGSYTITAFGANGCSTSFAPVTITQPTSTVPDITMSVAEFTDNLFRQNGSEITILYQIQENNGNPAFMDSLRITKQGGYTFSFPSVSSVTITGTQYPVDNQRWAVDPATVGAGSFYRVGIHAGEQIPCGQSVYLAVKVTRNSSSKSNFALTSQVVGVQGEVVRNNNSTVFVCVGQ